MTPTPDQQPSLTAEPLTDSNAPGWRIQSGTRHYVLWAPRRERTYNLTFGGPLTVKARDHFAVAWDDDKSDLLGDYWRNDTLDEVLAALPSRIEQAFRRAQAWNLPVDHQAVPR